MMPFIFLSFITMRYKIWAHKIKRYRDIGSPCLHPLSIGKGFDRNQHWLTEATMLVLKSLSILIKLVPKFKKNLELGTRMTRRLPFQSRPTLLGLEYFLSLCSDIGHISNEYYSQYVFHL